MLAPIVAFQQKMNARLDAEVADARAQHRVRPSGR